MGDRFRPSERDRDRRLEYDRFDRYDRRYERPSYYDQSPRRDAFSRYERSRSPRGDWRPRDRREESSSNGYVFRGAAARDSYRSERPQDTFSFRAMDSSAPRFPSPERRPPPQRRAPTDRRGPGASRGNYGSGFRGRGGFRSRKANTREILNKIQRGGTPEQLEGMNVNGQAHFADIIDSSSEGEDESVVDLTKDSDDDQYGDRPPAKRTKTEALTSETVAPRWSNPDPYTSLPPPETLGAPKKDIVQVIRKAKLDATHQNESANAVKANEDFISFFSDVGSEEGEASDVSMSLQSRLPPPVDAPSAPASMRDDPRSHDNEFSLDFTPINSRPPISLYTQDAAMEHANGSLPPRPVGVSIPSSSEIENVARQVQGRGGRKRKFDEQSKAIGDIAAQWRADGSNPCPWYTADLSHVNEMNLRLHDEICQFMEFVQPKGYEAAIRQQLITRIQDTIRRWTGPASIGARRVEIRCFGSFAAGLYLPTADMDLVAISPDFLRSGRAEFCQSKKAMRKLGDHLQRSGIAESLTTVLHAKVPIVKFIDKLTGIRVDISFENDSGLIANQTFQEWKVKYPAMPTLVVLVKQLLAMRELNEVFSGGLGGFSIICLVVNMLHTLPDPDKLNYGDLLLRFLNLYGNDFNLSTTGLNMDPPGTFNKIKYPMPKQNRDGLTIRDPNRPENDISGGSREIHRIFGLFRISLASIQERLIQIRRGVDPSASVLACVLGGSYATLVRQRNKLSLLHRGRPSSPPRVTNFQHRAAGGPVITAEPLENLRAIGPTVPATHSGGAPIAAPQLQTVRPVQESWPLPQRPATTILGREATPVVKPTAPLIQSDPVISLKAIADTQPSFIAQSHSAQHEAQTPSANLQSGSTAPQPEQGPASASKKSRKGKGSKGLAQLHTERAARRTKRNETKQQEAVQAAAQEVAHEAVQGRAAPKKKKKGPPPMHLRTKPMNMKARAAKFKQDYPHMENVPNKLGKKNKKKLEQEAKKQLLQLQQQL